MEVHTPQRWSVDWGKPRLTDTKQKDEGGKLFMPECRVQGNGEFWR